MSFRHWKTLPFCLRKKRPENALLILIVNYRKKTKQEKQIMPFKLTIHLLFNDM